MTTRKRLVPVRWTAGRDLEAHATTRRAVRTLCGIVPIGERHGWPALGRCRDCQRVLDGLEGAVRT